MNEGVNKPSVDSPKQETQKLEMTSQPTIESQPKEEKGSLSSQVEVLLSSTEYASRQSEFLEKLNAFSGQEDLIIGIMQQALTYNRQDILEDVLNLDEFGDELPVQIGTIRDKITPTINNQEKESEKFVSDYMKNNVQDFLQNEFSVRYKEDMDFTTELPKDLSENQIQKLQDLLNDIKNNQTDNVRLNGLGTIEKQLEEFFKNTAVKEQNTAVKEQNTAVKEQNVEVKEENTLESKIRNASNNLNELGPEKAKPIVEKIFEHGNVTQELKNEYNSGNVDKRKEIIANALTNIAKDTNNTQAIEDILMVAAQADPKGVEGETFKAFYAVFETSGVAPDVLLKIREKISTNKKEKSSLNKEQQKEYFTGVTSAPTEDEKGFLTYENQKIDLSEIPPVRYVKTQGNLEIKATDKEYYTALREKNQKEHISEKKTAELRDLHGQYQENVLERGGLEQKTAELEKRLEGVTGNELDDLALRSELEGDIKENKDKIDQLKREQTEMQKKIDALQKEIKDLNTDVVMLGGKLGEREKFLTEKKDKAQNTANFLDNIGFTQIPKDDVDWMLSQVNAFDATYYGFSQPLDFENGFDYQSSKGYQEFIKFFNTLLFGKDTKNHKIPNDYKTFVNGTDIANSAPSFQQLLKQQGVLREDGRLNQFNFFQKFSSRNTEKVPTEKSPKESTEAK